MVKILQSVLDKVYRMANLRKAGAKGCADKKAAGVDRVTVGAWRTKEEAHLRQLQTLTNGCGIECERIYAAGGETVEGGSSTHRRCFYLLGPARMELKVPKVPTTQALLSPPAKGKHWGRRMRENSRVRWQRGAGIP